MTHDRHGHRLENAGVYRAGSGPKEDSLGRLEFANETTGHTYTTADAPPSRLTAIPVR